MSTTSKLLQVIADFRKRLFDQEEQAQAELERAHANTLATIKPALDKLYDEMMEYLERGKKIPIRFLYEANRLEIIKLLISGQIDQYAALAHSTTLHMQNVGVQLGKQSALEQLEVVVPPQILDLLRQAGIKGAFGVPSLEAINQLIGATQKGSPLATLFQRWGAHAADRIAQTLITGITLGNNPRVVARHVRRIMEEQADTALGDSRNRALVISRTELNRAARNASLATMRENSDIITKYRRTCAKNSRTCVACIALDGKLYDLDTDFAIHPNDRCTAVPVTKDWGELLGPYGIDTSSIPDTRPQIETGESWFKGEPEDVQRKIIGTRRGYELYKAGKVTLQDFVTHRHSDDWGESIGVTPLRELVRQ